MRLFFYIGGYVALLLFVCYQVWMLARILSSAAWRWIATGFALSFLLTVTGIVAQWSQLRQPDLSWTIWLWSFLRSYAGLICIAIGFHKLHKDLPSVLR